MSDEKTREEYQADLAQYGDALVAMLPAPGNPDGPKVPFVPCASLLLSQIVTKVPPEEEGIGAFFDQYFLRVFHSFLDAQEIKLLKCDPYIGDELLLNPAPNEAKRAKAATVTAKGVDAGSACLPPSCVTLAGIRGSASYRANPVCR